MKRWKAYQYRFEIASRGGVRRYINKSRFSSRKEAQEEGAIAYNEYFRTGRKQKIKDMSYEDYLDYWMTNYCYFNVKYASIYVGNYRSWNESYWCSRNSKWNSKWNNSYV